MKDNAESLQAQLRQVADYESKGLLRAEEAAAQRTALQKRLMQVLLPADPAPRISWRARAWALAGMVVLVGSVSAYLISGHAGLRRRSEELLDAGKAAAAQDAQARQRRLERLRAGESIAPDARGLFPSDEPPRGLAAGPLDPPKLSASGGRAAGLAMSASDAATIAPLLAGEVRLDASLAKRAAPDDAVFIVVRLPDDPTGLPLAAVRRQVSDLPAVFSIGAREIVGAPARFMQARDVVVTARVSHSGSGLARSGDLVGATPAAPWREGVVVTIDRAVP